MMKRIMLAAVLSLSLPALAKEVSTTVKVRGWHCAGCAQETEDAVKQVKGVKTATADFDKHTVVVGYDDALAKPAQIQRAIAKAGYHVAK